MNKLIFSLTLCLVIIACGAKNGKKGSPEIDAKKLFKINCMLCHGADGKLGANGSKDLSKSPLSMDDRVAIIANGKGAMTPYKGILSAEEIKALAEYTFQLK